MEDVGDMAYYSSNSLERVFSTMGEMAPIGNIYMGMEHLMGGLVSPTSNNRGFPPTGGALSVPFSVLDLAVLELSPSVSVAIPISEQDPQILTAPGL